VQQVQEMRADRVVVGLDFDAPPASAEVMPVDEHRAERGHEAVGDLLRAGDAVIVFLGLDRAEHRYARAHHVHGVRGGRHGLERRLHRRG
jgi:hypothetical protein